MPTRIIKLFPQAVQVLPVVNVKAIPIIISRAVHRRNQVRRKTNRTRVQVQHIRKPSIHRHPIPVKLRVLLKKLVKTSLPVQLVKVP